MKLVKCAQGDCIFLLFRVIISPPVGTRLIKLSFRYRMFVLVALGASFSLNFTVSHRRARLSPARFN